MPTITTREGLKQYCLRKLGAPVVKIDVDDQQVEDRLDDALGYFMDFHGDGVEKTLLKIKLTASTLTFATALPQQFTSGELIEGATSGATCKFLDQATNNLSARVRNFTGTFVNGETVVGQVSGTTKVLAAANAVTFGIVDNQYLPLDDSIVGVIDVMPLVDDFSGGDISMFDIRYQMAQGAALDLSYTDMTQYTMIRSHLSLIDFLFNGKPGYEFNRYMNRLKLNMDWANDAVVDQYIILHVHKLLDPADYPRVYNSWWLQSYAAANIKMQWGQNLKKFGGLQLPGGVTFSGQQIYDEAVREMEKLEEDAKKIYQEPPIFFIG